jgi:hypothetical protein
LAAGGHDVGFTWAGQGRGGPIVSVTSVHGHGPSFVVDGGLLLMGPMANQLAR